MRLVRTLSLLINDFFRHRRMSDLESMNEALRRALSLRQYNRVDNSGVLGKTHLTEN